MFKNLRDYISQLEKAGELVRIKEQVTPDLEIAEITDRVSSSKDGGKALLFENSGTQFPVITNLFGSDKRIAMALGVNNVADLTTRIDTLLGSAMSPKKTLMEKLQMLPLLSNVASWMPKNKCGRGECQNMIIKGDDIDLSILPILKCAPYDAAPFITLPLVHTFDPETGARNIGMYRMQVMSKNSTGMHWHTHKTGERHYRAYKKIEKRMPVTVVLGGDPAYTYAATAPLPDGVDEYMLSGFIRGRAVELVKCITNEHRVPADADFVIEGYVNTNESKVTEGPFADHTGFYSLEDLYPVFHVTCITHRRDAIYPATLVGIPPKEDAYIAKATEKIFLSPIKAVMQPEVRDMWLPMQGVAHNLAIVDIEKSYEGQGQKVASSLLGAGQMMFTKFIVVTKGFSGKLSQETSLKEIVSRIVVSRDITVTSGVMDVLDHTATVMGVGGKMSFDATNKGAIQEMNLPLSYQLTSGITAVNDELARKGWSVLLVKLSHNIENFKKALTDFYEINKITGVKCVLAMDSNVNLNDYSTVMWLVGGNVDAKRDTCIFEETLFMDARAKFGGVNGFSRRWPNVITMSDEIIEKVDLKWNSYGIGKLIASPSNKYKPLLFGGKAAVEV